AGSRPAEESGGRGEGFGQAEQGEGRQGQQAAGARDRAAQAQGPERLRCRGRDEDDRRDGALTRNRGVCLMPQARGKKYKEAAKAISGTGQSPPGDGAPPGLRGARSNIDGV